MRLHRKGQRSLGAGEQRIYCSGGPRDGEDIWVPVGTKEFFAIDHDADTAIDPDDLLPIWRYSSSALAFQDGPPVFTASRVQDL